MLFGSLQLSGEGNEEDMELLVDDEEFIEPVTSLPPLLDEQPPFEALEILMMRLS